MLSQLDENRTQLTEALPRAVPNIAWAPPQATYLAWLDFRETVLGDDPARSILRSGRLALSPGQDYGINGVGFARLNFGTSSELLDEQIRRLARAAESSSALHGG